MNPKTELSLIASQILLVIEEEVFITPFPPRIPGVMHRTEPCESPWITNKASVYAGFQISNRRRQKNMTQVDLACLVHVDVSQVSRHENGRQLSL